MTSKQGRNVGEPRHVRLYEWLQASPAWRSLDAYERALYLEFKRRYSGNNNGNIGFSGDEMAASINCSNKPADRALKTLIDRGFIKIAKKGHFDWKWRREGGNRSNTYTLTEYPVDYPLKVLSGATKDFMKWRPSPLEISTPKKKSRDAVVTPMGVRGHPINEGMGCSRPPNGVLSSPDQGKNAASNGVLSSPAYSLPDREGLTDQPEPALDLRKRRAG